MPLTSDYRKIKDYEEVDGSVKEMFTFYTMFLGMNSIKNEDEAKEFFKRYKLYDALFGHLYTKNAEPEPVPVHISYPEVERMIGLTTNVSPETFASWKNRMVKRFIGDVESDMKRFWIAP